MQSIAQQTSAAPKPDQTDAFTGSHHADVPIGAEQAYKTHYSAGVSIGHIVSLASRRQILHDLSGRSAATSQPAGVL